MRCAECENESINDYVQLCKECISECTDEIDWKAIKQLEFTNEKAKEKHIMKLEDIKEICCHLNFMGCKTCEERFREFFEKENECKKEVKNQFYKCGHDRGIVVLDDNELSMVAYFDWKDTVGFDGDKSLCWKCYCKKDEPNHNHRANSPSGKDESTKDKLKSSSGGEAHEDVTLKICSDDGGERPTNNI